MALPSFALAAGVDSSQPIQKDIANVSPQVANASAPLFTTLDSMRMNINGVLQTQLANTKATLSTTQKPDVTFGTSTNALSDATISNPWGTFWYVLYTIYFYILTILQWIVDTAIVFYPVLLLLILYIIWHIFRFFRRPRY